MKPLNKIGISKILSMEIMVYCGYPPPKEMSGSFELSGITAKKGTVSGRQNVHTGTDAGKLRADI